MKYLNSMQHDTFERNFLEMMQNSQQTRTKDKSKARHTRSLPLIRLAMDPNSKLNMPKTLENIGTIARNSFEDQHAPMYHVRNMIGHVKNAFLSGLRMAPQDLIIPSQYRIIDTKEEMVMKPADIVEIKARAAAEATAEAEARAARERDHEREQERRREAFSPPKPIEIVKPASAPDFLAHLNDLKNLREQWFKKTFATPKVKPFDESALRRKAFGLGESSTPILGSRMNAGEDEVDPFDFLKTFQKVGAVVRGSIKSGQETIQHISEAAHSARKAYNTARFAAPRVLLPYTRAPAIEQDRNKVMFITPRFLDIENDHPANRVAESPMVGMGEIMNAFGVANPESQKVQKQRIIVEKTTLPQPGKIPIFEARFGGDDNRDDPLKTLNQADQYYVYAEDIDEDADLPKDLTIDDTLKSLQALKDIIGAKSITQFLEEMKRDFQSMHFTHKVQDIQDLKSQLNEAEIMTRIAEVDEEGDRELRNFLNNLFADQASKIEKNQKLTSQQTTEAQNIRSSSSEVKASPQSEEAAPSPPPGKDIVGSKLFLPQNLLKPFMNQPNTQQLNEYFRENGDFEEIKNDSEDDYNNLLKMHALVAAINPEMYQELFNQTLTINPNSTVLHPEFFFNNTKLKLVSKQQPGARNVSSINPQEEETRHSEDLLQMNLENLQEPQMPAEDLINKEDELRASMHFPKKLLEPFMGKKKIKPEYYYDYGYDDSY